MSASKSKLKILYVMKILLEDSDENHHLTVSDFIYKLSIYGINAERKSIYADIEALKSFGLDIICEKSQSNKYYIASRDFELAEIKLLVDAIQASKFVTSKKSDELIKKLGGLVSSSQSKNLRREVVVDNRIKNMNESIYYNVDAIHDAIQKKKKINFKYFDYTVDKTIEYRRDNEIYSVSPYALYWSDDRYYLIGYHARYGRMSNFRVDRMASIVTAKEAREVNAVTADFNIVDYTQHHFKMFNGDVVEVELQFDNSIVNSVIDKFGKDVMIFGRTKNSFRISIMVSPTTTFFGWLFMYRDKVKIINPPAVVDSMKDHINAVLSIY